MPHRAAAERYSRKLVEKQQKGASENRMRLFKSLAHVDSNHENDGVRVRCLTVWLWANMSFSPVFFRTSKCYYSHLISRLQGKIFIFEENFVD